MHAPAVSAWRAGWERARPLAGTEIVLPALAAVTLFGIAYAGGGYSVSARLSLGIAVWWTLALVVALGLAPRARVPLAAATTALPLAALAVLALVSARWGASAERALLEADRVALYVGVFALVVLVTRPGEAGRWADALALALVGVAGIALASRLFTGLFPEQEEALADALAGEMRLSFPVGYWNGLAILVALAVPLLLRIAAAPRAAAVRGAAVGALAALPAVIYLTSSRGGTAAAGLAALAYVVLSGRRWAALGALAVAAAGGAAAVVVLRARPELANDPLSAAAGAQGRSAAPLLLAIVLVAAVAYALAAFVARWVPPAPRAVRYGAGGLIVAGLVAAVAAADPRARFEAFREPPTFSPASDPDFVRSHLASTSGSGRWQFWHAAVEQYRESPLLGAGAGTYEAWWAQHGTLPMFVRDAHSLYFETLGELGLVGLALVVVAFAAGLGVAVVRLTRRTADRETLAALTAVFLAFAVGASIDWMWELTVVTLVAVVCLALMTGPATRPVPAADNGAGDEGAADDGAAGDEAEAEPPRGRGPGLAAAALALAVALPVVGAHAAPLLGEVALRDSERAAATGDVASARDRAGDARSLQPWAASARLQLALVEERAGRLAAARSHIGAAIERDDRDWRLWLVRARLETTAGDAAAGRDSLRRAIELNPRSPLFAGAPPSPASPPAAP